jgi:hippurate hydrolase
MHACGHDGHVATLITCALWLKKHEVQLPGPVSLLFQPAEEGGHGAKAMIAEGALEGVDRIYGWHNWPAIPFGHATCPDGIVMAVNGTFHIQLHGKGGHSSQPELCRDPVLAASALNLALQQIVSRRIPPQRVAVLSVTSIIASGGLTTIPDLARMHGSIRVEDDPMRDNMAQWIEEIAHQVAGAYGVRAEVEFRRRYNATINDPHCARQMREVLKAELGEGWKSEHLVPVMASEDFSYYLERIPGAYALVGSDDGVASHSIPCHNSCYDFNDRLIKPVSRCLMRLAGLREAYLHGLW